MFIEYGLFVRYLTILNPNSRFKGLGFLFPFTDGKTQDLKNYMTYKARKE